MKKIIFIINKSSEERYQECVASINSLKKPFLWEVGYGAYTSSSEYVASDAYLELQESASPDISIMLDDTVLLVNENLLLDIIRIFTDDSSVGVVGVKGCTQLPDSGIIDEAADIYGGMYETDCQGDVYEKKYNDSQDAWRQVEAVSSILLAVRGYIPVWNRVGNRCIGEVFSVAAAIRGYKAVVPRNSYLWCYLTQPEARLSQKELEYVQGKYKFKRILFSKNHYLLTIGIPTYNRSKYFSRCIENIYRQVGDIPWVEVFVSDNDSQDNTEEIAGHYRQYKNFRYYRQPVNIGGDRNFDYLYDNASGDFVVACGDDDYYSPQVPLNLLEAICLYPESSVMDLAWQTANIPAEIIPGFGIDEFLVKCTIVCTCISCIVFNRRHYMAIEEKKKFFHTQLNQCYTQLEMVSKNPQFVFINNTTFIAGSGEATAMSGKRFEKEERGLFGNVFIRQYYQIVEYFFNKGLSQEAYEQEKRIYLGWLLSWMRYISQKGDKIVWMIDNDIEDIIKEHYGYEPYYEELIQEVRSIVAEK